MMYFYIVIRLYLFHISASFPLPNLATMTLLCHCLDEANSPKAHKEGMSEESHCKGKVNVKVKKPLEI